MIVKAVLVLFAILAVLGCAAGLVLRRVGRK